MRVLILGASGMLGYDLARVFSGRELLLSDLKIEGKNTAAADITDLMSLRKLFKDFKPEAVVNSSAYTDVDACETKPELAYAVNADGAGNIAFCANEIQGCKLVHVSTDYVFDGLDGKPHSESDAVNPLGVYGKSKLEGEKKVRAIAKNSIVARTALLYGKNKTNFVKKILERAEKNLPITVPEDMIGSPTYSLELARIIERLIDGAEPGIYHTVNKGWCSRFDWAKKICALAGLSASISAIKSAALPAGAPRPLFSALLNNRLEATIGDTMKPWEEALAEFISKDLNYNARP